MHVEGLRAVHDSHWTTSRATNAGALSTLSASCSAAVVVERERGRAARKPFSARENV